ncbi:MAG: isoaspartyl peptidase/L-asparaginase [Hyphomonadaceae bacterium]|nr:isoaspartyl peptidase/L-asparaginase [Hyphomonadaceae bacterium]
MKSGAGDNRRDAPSFVDFVDTFSPSRGRRVAAVLAALALAACAAVPREEAHIPQWSIAIHGGAGVIERGQMSPALEQQYQEALSAAARAGGDVLAKGGSALDAVETVVRRMEDDPLFNAGRGAVFTAEGRNELDASIMDGTTRKAGAVAGVTRTRHPISLARAVMEKSPHVMLIGEGAETFARAQGLEEVAPSFFFTERRWQGLVQELARQSLPVPPRPQGAPPATAQQSEASPLEERKFGTVGVVVHDARGNLAAGTSTGGMTGKRWGRVGDAPIIGAGTYAQNGVCAVSATGSGEYFIRLSVARMICARMERGESAQAAADAVIQRELTGIGGDGGVIVMGADGVSAWSLNTSGMYRARFAEGGTPIVGIYKDDE